MARARFFRLVRAGETGQRRLDAAGRVPVDELAVIGGEEPGVPRGRHARTCGACDRLDSVSDGCGVAHRDKGDSLLGDAGLLAGDLFGGVPKEALMIDAKLGDAGNEWAGDDVGRVEPAAQADLDNAGVGRGTGEGEKSGCGGNFEEACADVAGDIEHFPEQGGEGVVVDQVAGDADSFVEADEMRAGIDMRGEAGGLDRGAEKGAGRAFAVGAGDMEDRWQAVLRVAETGEQRRDALKAKDVGTGGERPEAVELMLDGG